MWLVDSLLTKSRFVLIFFVLMNFFPFPFLQEEAPTEASPGEEQNVRNFSAKLEKRDDSYYLVPDEGVTQTQESGQPPGRTDGGAGEIGGGIGPSQYEKDNFDADKINEDVSQGDRTLWSPQVKPWVLEDLQNHEKSVLWNAKTRTGESKTVGITFIVNSDDQIVWLNEETFRDEYARIILQNEVNIRTLYYVIQAFLDSLEDEDIVIALFSQNNTINMSQPAWFYWRVEKECVAITPYTDIKAFVDKSKRMEEMFEVFHQKMVEEIQKILEQCAELYQRNQHHMQQMADTIETQAGEVQQQIEAITNQTIEQVEAIKQQNETVVQECNSQMQLYAAQIMDSRQQVVDYNQHVKAAIEQMMADAEETEKEQMRQIVQHENELAHFIGSMNFIKAGMRVKIQENENTQLCNINDFFK